MTASSAKLSRRAGIAAGLAAFAVAGRALAQTKPELIKPQATPMTQPPAQKTPQQQEQLERALRERRFLIEEAERHLVRARELLFHAGHEFGGHRLRAIQFIDGAMAETNASRGFMR